MIVMVITTVFVLAAILDMLYQVITKRNIKTILKVLWIVAMSLVFLNRYSYPFLIVVAILTPVFFIEKHVIEE